VKGVTNFSSSSGIDISCGSFTELLPDGGSGFRRFAFICLLLFVLEDCLLAKRLREFIGCIDLRVFKRGGVGILSGAFTEILPDGGSDFWGFGLVGFFLFASEDRLLAKRLCEFIECSDPGVLKYGGVGILSGAFIEILPDDGSDFRVLKYGGVDIIPCGAFIELLPGGFDFRFVLVCLLLFVSGGDLRVLKRGGVDIFIAVSIVCLNIFGSHLK
jgi:hypothetical protein